MRRGNVRCVRFQNEQFHFPFSFLQNFTMMWVRGLFNPHSSQSLLFADVVCKLKGQRWEKHIGEEKQKCPLQSSYKYEPYPQTKRLHRTAILFCLGAACSSPRGVCVNEFDGGVQPLVDGCCSWPPAHTSHRDPRIAFALRKRHSNSDLGANPISRTRVCLLCVWRPCQDLFFGVRGVGDWRCQESDKRTRGLSPVV